MSEQKNNTPAVQNKAVAQIDYLAGQIEKAKPEFAKSLPAHVDVNKFARMAVSVLRANPSLQECTGQSIMASLGKAASDGLMPDGREAAIVKYGATAVYIQMIKGILKLMRNSGDIASIQPHVVYINDEFIYLIDETGTKLKHTPCLEDDRGTFKLVYSIARMKTGETIITTMTKKQVDKIRNVSRSKNSGPWVDWYDEMAEKSVLKKQAKFLPSSTDLENLFKNDDDVDFAHAAAANAEDKPAAENNKKPNRLKEKIKDKVAAMPVAPADTFPDPKDPPELVNDMIDDPAAQATGEDNQPI